MERKICGIYMIKNKVNNKAYIGQSNDIYGRWKEHICSLRKDNHYNNHLQRAWNKYGADNFDFIIIEECSEDRLDEREIYWIEKQHTYDNGYNQTKGGGGMRGFNFDEETRHKMSIAAQNRPPISEDTRQKLREKMLGENNHFYGVRLYGEQNRFYGNHKFAGKNHPRCRAVYCYELDEYFWGAKEAQDKYGIHKADIAKCCNGKLKSAGKHPITGEKLHWVYVDEMDNSSIA